MRAEYINSAQTRTQTFCLAYYKYFKTSYLTVGCDPCTSASCATSISMASWRLTHCVRSCNSSEKHTECSYTLMRLCADFMYFRYFASFRTPLDGRRKDRYLSFKEWSSCTSHTKRTMRCEFRTQLWLILLKLQTSKRKTGD
jgi:hypothetical protein